jgi:hypothetical protein
VPAQTSPIPSDPATPVGLLRLMINDTETGDPVFVDSELQALLAAEGDVVKLAAAQALDIIADDEALTSKVIRTQDLSTDGAKLADSLRKRAAALREQVADSDGGFFELVDGVGTSCVPELTEWPRTSYGYRGW